MRNGQPSGCFLASLLVALQASAGADRTLLTRRDPRKIPGLACGLSTTALRSALRNVRSWQTSRSRSTDHQGSIGGSYSMRTLRTQYLCYSDSLSLTELCWNSSILRSPSPTLIGHNMRLLRVNTGARAKRITPMASGQLCRNFSRASMFSANRSPAYRDFRGKCKFVSVIPLFRTRP